jgi:hypothetical protein
LSFTAAFVGLYAAIDHYYYLTPLLCRVVSWCCQVLGLVVVCLTMELNAFMLLHTLQVVLKSMAARSGCTPSDLVPHTKAVHQ